MLAGLVLKWRWRVRRQARRRRLPDDLIFKVDYLGGEMPTFALNFSRPGAQVAAQYYSFVRLGFDGYRLVHQESRETVQWLAAQIASMPPFELSPPATASPPSPSA